MLQHDVENLVLEEYEAMYRLAYVYVRNEQDAMDVVQESVFKALKSAETVRDPEHARSWLFRIVVNSAYDIHKKRKREILKDEMPEAVASDSYQDIDLETALSILEPRERLLISLRFFEDRKISDVAEIMDMNVNSVKTLLYRTLNKLRINMEEESK